MDALYIYGGPEIEQLLETLPDPTDDQVSVPDYVKASNETANDFHKNVHKLHNHFSTMVNKDSARCKFDGLTQGDQSMATFYVSLKQQAEKCRFPDADDAIRSKILQTMVDKRLRREAMLKEYSLTKTLQEAANHEDMERQAKEMAKMSLKEDVKQVYTQRKQKKFSRGKQTRQPNKVQSSAQVYKPTPREQAPNCPYCGTSHGGPRTSCSASGKTCSKCKRRGHFASVCHSTGKKCEVQQARHLDGEAADYDSESDKEFTFALNPSKKDRPTVKITINGVLGRADADSCSSVNVMGIQQYTKIAQKAGEQMPLNPADTPLYAYAQSTPIPTAGRFHAKTCSVTTGRSVDAEFLVIDQQANSRPLLSFETAAQLGVMQDTQKLTTPNVTQKLTTLNLCKKAVIQKFPQVFNGIGLHKTIQAKLIVDMSVTPTAQKPRKIPYNLTRLAQKEEDRLLEAGIIEKVPDDIATTWCTNPVIVPKPHKPDHIRYCSNMRVPNTAIKRPITEAPTVNDIRVMMSGSTVFSTLDMNEAYHQLELHPKSRQLTTFYGTQGRLRYKRLNFGTISAQDMFDKAVDDTIQGLQGVVHIRDDFIIHG